MDTKELIEELKDAWDSLDLEDLEGVRAALKNAFHKLEELTQLQQTINLAELEDKLDKALDGETPESLKQWLSEQRQQQKKYTDMDNETSDVLWHELRIYCKKHYGIPWDKMWQDVGGAVLWRCLSGFILNYKNRVENMENRISHLRGQLSNAMTDRDKLQQPTEKIELINRLNLATHEGDYTTQMYDEDLEMIEKIQSQPHSVDRDKHLDGYLTCLKLIFEMPDSKALKVLEVLQERLSSYVDRDKELIELIKSEINLCVDAHLNMESKAKADGNYVSANFHATRIGMCKEILYKIDKIQNPKKR